MANKFLGEAGLGVLTEEIKKKTYVGQKLDEVLWAYAYKATHPNDDFSKDGMKSGIIANVFTATIFFSALTVDNPDLDTENPQLVYEAIINCLSKQFDENADLTYEEVIRSFSFMEDYVFNFDPTQWTGSINIQEITAQEVTDKFNS